MSKVKKVGYIGLGNAGYPLCGLLPKAGYEVVVRDADPARAEQFAKEHEGAEVAEDGPSGFRDVDVLVTMLPNGDIVRQVLLGENVEGIAKYLKDGEFPYITRKRDFPQAIPATLLYILLSTILSVVRPF